MQAVVFVRDLDRSVLGWGGHGLEHYLKLRAATDIVVNSILRVRRLLKQKRVANAGGNFSLAKQCPSAKVSLLPYPGAIISTLPPLSVSHDTD